MAILKARFHDKNGDFQTIYYKEALKFPERDYYCTCGAKLHLTDYGFRTNPYNCIHHNENCAKASKVISQNKILYNLYLNKDMPQDIVNYKINHNSSLPLDITEIEKPSKKTLVCGYFSSVTHYDGNSYISLYSNNKFYCDIYLKTNKANKKELKKFLDLLDDIDKDLEIVVYGNIQYKQNPNKGFNIYTTNINSILINGLSAIEFIVQHFTQ